MCHITSATGILTQRRHRATDPASDIDSVAFYNSYLATYLERDVRALANVGSLRDFERFLRACALRSANLLNKADLARDIVGKT
jgi:hypothetical protein